MKNEVFISFRDFLLKKTKYIPPPTPKKRSIKAPERYEDLNFISSKSRSKKKRNFKNFKTKLFDNSTALTTTSNNSSATTSTSSNEALSSTGLPILAQESLLASRLVLQSPQKQN